MLTTLSITSLRPRCLRCSRSGNATLSSTFSESRSAAYWNTIPNFCRTRFIWYSLSRPMSSPSTQMCPVLGFSRPISIRRRVVLPAPEPPMITAVSRRRRCMVMPRMTGVEPNDFFTSSTRM